MGRIIKVGFGLSTLVGALLLPTGLAQAVEVPPDCAVPPFVDLTQYNVIIGTDDSEVITGTSGADFICGRLGDDTIRSLGGADIVLGDNTTFFGNVGAAGGAGHDRRRCRRRRGPAGAGRRRRQRRQR